MTSPDYYKILGVARSATPQEIKAAYRKMAQRHHPDKNTGREDEATMAMINRAYAVLSDPTMRAHYDATGETQQRVDPIEEAANGCVVELFSESIEAGVTLDVVGFCRGVAGDRIDGCDQQITKGKILIADLQKRRQLVVRSKDGPNVYVGLIDKRIEALQRTLASNVRLKKVLIRAQQLLNDYASDDPQAPPGPGGTDLNAMLALADPNRRRRSPFVFQPPFGWKG